MFKPEVRGNEETRLVTKETLPFNGIIRKGGEELCRARSRNIHGVPLGSICSYTVLFFMVRNNFMTFSESSF